MKLRQISFKIISMVMVFAMMFGMSATTISALANDIATISEENTDKKLNYVSIGDSMANGYGFTGYEQGSDDLDFIGGGEGVYGKDSYPMLFEKYLEDKGYDVEHTKLASSALRAEDLCYLLGGLENPTDDWFEQVNNYTNCDDNARLSAHFQNAVANADIITLGVGNASFGAFLMSRATGLIGVMGSYPEENIYKLDESLLGKLDAEQLEIVLDVYNETIEYLMSYIPADVAEQYPVTDVAELLAYTVANFILGFKGSVEKIVELNSDAEIILIGLMNTTYGLNLTIGETKIPVGDYMDNLFATLNAYIAGLPAALQIADEVADAEFYYAEQTNPEFICQVFDDMAALGWDDASCDEKFGLSAEIVRGRTLKAYNDSLRYALSNAFSDMLGGELLPEVTLEDARNFEALAAEGDVNWSDYQNPAQGISIAIALGIEDAIAATCEITDIPLTALKNIADIEALMDIFTEGNVDLMVIPSELRGVLADFLSGEEASDIVKGMCKIYGLFKIGDGMCVHPTPASHALLADEIIRVYTEGYTALDETIKNAVIAAETLADFVAEYYDEAYAEAYKELAKAGYIDIANTKIDDAIKATNQLIEIFEDLDVDSDYKDTIALVITELNQVISTLYIVQDIINNPEINDEMIASLNELLGNLESHYENLSKLVNELSGELVEDANEQLIIAVNALNNYLEEKIPVAVDAFKNFANELAVRAYAQLVKLLSEQYDAFVNAAVNALGYYSHEGAKYLYNWLINNPETVIEFFDKNGDEIGTFLATNGVYVASALAFVATTYGEEIFTLVLENADIILPAVAQWFSIHGDLVWDLIVVYFNAIVEYYNLGLELDVPTIEFVTISFVNIYDLLDQLIDMIADGVYDYVDSLNLMEKLQAQLVKLHAYLLGKAEDALVDLGVLVQTGLKNLGEYIYGEIVKFVDNAICGKYTPDENTNIVSVNSGNGLYAELLKDYIEGMYADTEHSYNASLDEMTWDAIDYDKLAAADIVTIGFEEKEISGFVLNQLLAYVANYVDTDLRNNTNEYIDDVFVKLNEAFHEVVDGKFNIDFDFNDYKANASESINGTIDGILDYDMIADKELTELDWAKYFGENHASYIDELRAYLKAKLIEAGIPENYYYTIDVVEYLYANAENLGIEAALNFIVKDYAYEVLGEKAYYDIEIPVIDTLVFALESYLYGNVKLQAEYAQLIVDLYMINPEATVILLGHYNPYDVELNYAGISVDLGPIYAGMAGLYSFQPFTYALLSDKVLYVDIYNAETSFDYIDGEEDNVMWLLLDVAFGMFSSDITDEGHYYIFEQILNVLTFGCDHVYANACDADCDRCGEIRTVGGHEYDNCEDTICNLCGETRVAPGHNYGDDNICDDCGYERPTTPDVPVFPTPDPDPECLKGNHYYDDCEDTTCYKCDEVREAPGHEYDCDGKCANCDSTVDALGHVYANAHDKDCDRCGATRTVEACKGHSCVDTTCKTCGATITAGQHTFGDWTVLQEVSRDANGYEVHSCKVCGLREIKVIYALDSLSVGAIVGIVIGSVVVAGAAGFAIFWFLIQKKTFAALMEAVKGLVAKISNPEALAAEANAPANEEETK